MRADLDAVLSKVAVARAAVTGGFKYTLQSPDGLQLKVWVQDLGDGDAFHTYLRITPTSADEARTGPLGLLAFLQGDYEAWANPCGFFCAVLGIVSRFYNFACAILALPDGSGPCAVSGATPTVTELWCVSAASDNNFAGLNWRIGRYADQNWALAFNGVFVSTAGLFLCMMPLCSAFNVDYAYGNPGEIQRYTNGTGLRIDPLVSVGQQIYGQLWDAHYLTLPATLDSIQTLTDTDSDGNPVTSSWVVWNNAVPPPPTAGTGTTLLSLLLLTESATHSLANIAY